MKRSHSDLLVKIDKELETLKKRARKLEARRSKISELQKLDQNQHFSGKSVSRYATYLKIENALARSAMTSHSLHFSIYGADGGPSSLKTFRSHLSRLKADGLLEYDEGTKKWRLSQSKLE